MIRKFAEKNNKKFDKPIFSDKNSQKSAENTQFFDENTRSSEIRIHCLVNRSRALRNPKDKKQLDNRYYAQHNYTAEQILLDGICEYTLLKGYQFVPGEFTQNSERDIGIRNAKNWKSQQVFLIEFDNTTENTLNEFIRARPFLQQNGWLATESIRSRYDDPDDETCNGQLRPRLVFCMPRPVKTRDERDWVYDALVNALPGCDDGSANSITNGGLGRANAEHIKIGKIVDIDWFNRAIATGRQKKAEADKTKHERAEKRKRKQKERAAMGFTEREGELPLEALAKTDPSEVLESLGLSLKGESGQYQHWGRPEKQGDTALSVWQSAQGNWQICVFANSIHVPPSVSGAMPFTRFYCYHELNTDIEGLQPDSTQWKDINAQLASRGYRTWLTDEEFKAQQPEKEKRIYTAPKRLEINDTEQEAYKDNLCPPKANEVSLEKAITEFLQLLESYTGETTNIFILKYATGIGKSYGTLANARKLGKKVLSLLFNHDLAAEQTNTAKTLGYNAFRFKGRSYNFENSNLRVLPLQLREQNETLFRDKDVMCPVYDKLEPYHEKRLNPYMHCFSCPLLDACNSEGYWSQFSELRRADYLSACIQDILLNPDFWTLLETFLSGSVPFETPETDEESAIAAMLGLQENNAQGIFQPFDFAMIDDYTIAGLYSEAHYTLEEISHLTKAWEGTPTGDVLKQVLEAILMLYHPDGTQKSVAILTNLFDSLDDETKESINTNLTKHADRDEYGEVVPTAPWTALRKGIASLDTLTPIWHSKDWTLLHQLETIINHCENTAQAPMFIDNDGNITLFIPPQVHPKLKAILLMSATADIPGTQNSFRGQPVTFTTAEGAPSHWAKGVKGFQYVNARWTTQSIFEFQKDDNGNQTVYDDDGSPVIVGLRPKATSMLQKLTKLARADNRKCVFIGYKEFVEGEIAELEVVKQLHETFDTVTHYDIAPGMNFEGYKIFVTFGYPKVKWNIIKREARKQYAHDPEWLNFDYTTTSEQGKVYSSTHGRYIDPARGEDTSTAHDREKTTSRRQSETHPLGRYHYNRLFRRACTRVHRTCDSLCGCRLATDPKF